MSDTNEVENTQDNPQASQPESVQGQQNAQPSEATFTQAELDRIVGERAKRAKEAAVNSLLADLGFESPDDLKAIVGEAKKRKEAEMSELEKAQAAIDAATRKAQEAEAKVQEMQNRIIADGRKQAFLKAAQASGGGQVDDLFILVQAKHGQEFSSVFDEDTIPDDKKMQAFIKQVQSSFPSYFGVAGAGIPSNSNGFAPNSQNMDDATMQMIRRKFGKF